MYFKYKKGLHIKDTTGSEKQRCNFKVCIQVTKDENVKGFPKPVVMRTSERQPQPQNVTCKQKIQWNTPSCSPADKWK